MVSEYELTEEQKVQLKPWSDKWISHTFKTGKLSDAEKEDIREAVFGLYASAGLPAPEKVIFATSPYSAAIAYGICEGILDSKLSNAVKYKCARQVAEERVRLAFGRLASGDQKADPIDNQTADNVINHIMDLVTEISFDGIHPNVPNKTRSSSELVSAMVEGVRASHEAANAGNQASAWVEHVTFYRYVVKFDADYSKWDFYERAANGGPRYMHEQFTIVSDLPERSCVDQNFRPHSPDGPSHSWRDGWKVYNWRGTRVPSDWIENKESIDPKLALSWRNIEQRRCLAEIVGWKRILEQLDAKVIDQDPNPQIGTLLEATIPESGKSRFLRVLCGTGREFVLPVRRECRTALEANASTYNLRPEDLKNLEFRT